MAGAICKHLYPVLDAMISDSLERASSNGTIISCKAGCAHCCNLLVEVAWEEAQYLASFIKFQEKNRRPISLRARISVNAAEARRLFEKHEETQKYCKPYAGEDEIPDKIYDEYLYGEERRCPFLENGRCSVYAVRPSACRLHMVSSEPEQCSRLEQEESEFNIPEEVEELKEACAPMLEAIEKDGRWGQMAVMVEAVLEELDLTEEIEKINSDKAHAVWG